MAKTVLTGGCRCGKIRFKAQGEAAHHAICHCRDCQKASGAPMVAWIGMPSEGLSMSGDQPATYQSESGSKRQFCSTCGTPMFFFNEEILPGTVEIQTVLLDDPEAYEPEAQIQTAERLSWMTKLGQMHEFERFPAE